MTKGAIRTGFRDGLDQPYDFNVGMSYDSASRQVIYDLASHVGQWIGRLKEKVNGR